MYGRITAWIATMITVSLCHAQTIEVNVDQIMAEPGEMIVISIDVDAAVTNLRGYTLDLHYQRNYVDLFSISEGEVMLAASPTYIDWEDSTGTDNNNVIHVDHAILGNGTPAQGAGSLFYVTMLGENCGIEQLWIDNVELRDMDNHSIAVTVGPLVEHQVCQIPRLYIASTLDSNILLTWGRVLNANLFRLHRSPEIEGPWPVIHTTSDTSWIDTGIVIPETKQFYYLTVDHD
jgi:hypothetical protein